MLLLPEKGQVYKQKKPTMYPPWSTTFDAHIHRGRIMHVMVKDRTAELKSETSVALDSLATQCKKENGKLEIWVSGAAGVREALFSMSSRFWEIFIKIVKNLGELVSSGFLLSHIGRWRAL